MGRFSVQQHNTVTITLITCPNRKADANHRHNDHQTPQAVFHSLILRGCPISLQSSAHFLGLLPLLLDPLSAFGPWRRAGRGWARRFTLDRRVQFRTPKGSPNRTQGRESASAPWVTSPPHHEPKRGYPIGATRAPSISVTPSGWHFWTAFYRMLAAHMAALGAPKNLGKSGRPGLECANLAV